MSIELIEAATDAAIELVRAVHNLKAICEIEQLRGLPIWIEASDRVYEALDEYTSAFENHEEVCLLADRCAREIESPARFCFPNVDSTKRFLQASNLADSLSADQFALVNGMAPTHIQSSSWHLLIGDITERCVWGHFVWWQVARQPCRAAFVDEMPVLRINGRRKSLADLDGDLAEFMGSMAEQLKHFDEQNLVAHLRQEHAAMVAKLDDGKQESIDEQKAPGRKPDWPIDVIQRFTAFVDEHRARNRTYADICKSWNLANTSYQIANENRLKSRYAYWSTKKAPEENS